MLLHKDRQKVMIRCNLCGEKYTLVGKKGRAGQVETGFKQCLCNNERDFEIQEIDF
ncbi:hypothetical protein [Ammoniphilus oxalaticus]|uniref:hypothetical protein n=1 Tax=Ammoniphilus oxalaticus TaxID=66863 RepID=UPI0014749B5B|nr:hypothetical protein [Ammoniphilus oxalaticus]